MVNKPFQRGAGIAVLACCSALAQGQTPPDAGSLLRETERKAIWPAPAGLPTMPAPPLTEKAKGATVVVAAFRLSGITLLAEAELQALLADLIGQTLSLDELERAAQRLAEHYRQRGWFARVYLPQQEIVDGVVTIAIIEGRLGAIDIDAKAASRADADFVRDMVTAGLTLNEPLAADTLQRGLLLANDLPGIKARGQLETGDKIGETRLRLRIEDAPPLGGQVQLHNHGVKSTGAEQLIGGFDLYNLSGRGDQLAVRAVAARGLESLRLNYALPLGSDGLRLALRASDLRYRLGAGFSALNARGHAGTWGAGLSYPVLRSTAQNVSLGLDTERKRFADDMLGAPAQRRDNEVFSLAANGDAIDGLGGGGFTQYGVTLTHGRLDLAGVAAALATDQASARTQGGWSKHSASLMRLQRLPGDMTLSASLNAQWAGKNLDSSEKFSLGGPAAVRAYPVNEAAGDEGWLLNLELRSELGAGWQALGFIDAGEVHLHRNEWAGWQGGGSTPNRYALSGAGLGLSWQQPGAWSLRLTVAAPLGDNPGRNAAGNNSDGSGQRSARAWLQAMWLF